MKGPAVREELIVKRRFFLREVPLFAELSETNIETLNRHFRTRRYQRKEMIFHQGDDSHVLYVVMKGKVRIFCTSPAGNETSIRIFASHDLIGEFAAVDGRSRSTSAQAMIETTLLEMDRYQFLEILQDIPDLAMAMIRMLVEKLRWTTDFAESIAQYDTAGRLLHIILHYNELWGREIEHGKRYELELSINQTDLASMVGARREWVNRLLQDWRRRGLIDYKRGKINILDLSAVKKERERRIDLYGDDREW